MNTASVDEQYPLITHDKNGQLNLGGHLVLNARNGSGDDVYHDFSAFAKVMVLLGRIDRLFSNPKRHLPCSC